MTALTGRLGIFAGLAVLPWLLGHSAPGLVTPTMELNIGMAACIAAAALSLNLLMGYCGQISLAHYAILGIGAFTAAISTGPTRADLPFGVGLVIAVLVSGAAAFLVGLPALRLKGLYLAIITIGFSYMLEKSIFRTKAITGGSAGVEFPRPYFGTHNLLNNADYVPLTILALLLVWSIDRNVTRTKLGRAFFAIKADESVAASYGVNTSAYKLLAFTLSGAMTGLAGALYGGLYGFVDNAPYVYRNSLTLVIIVVVGGLGSRVGVLISALTFTLFPLILEAFFGHDILGLDFIIGSFLLMVTVAVQPGGFAAGIREAREKREAAARLREAGGQALAAAPNQPILPSMPRPKGLERKPSVPLGAALLTVTDVSVSFGGVHAVEHASFDVNRGTICGLIGPNGAGKSTLFNVVSGLLTPDTGRVVYAGHDITRLPPYLRAFAGIGRTFQLIGLAKDLSVMENLLLAQHTVATYSIPEALGFLGNAPRVEKQMHERAREAVSALGFEQYADTPVKSLSHGQQRIVEIGATLVTAPELVMLDEPSAGMSPGAAENLAVRLRDIRDQLGRTVLLIEHNIPLVLDVADELVVLAAGEVVANGEPLDVVARPAVVEAYLGKGYDDLSLELEEVS